MKLYEIAGQFAELFDQYDELIEDNSDNAEEIEQAWFDTLTAVEGEFEVKAESVAQYVKELTARAEAIKAEEQKLATRRKAYENRVSSMKDYLKGCMQSMSLNKVETAKARISIRNNAPSLKIDDEAKFIVMLQGSGRDDLLKYTSPEIKKNDIKTLMKNGEEFEGAHLEASQSLIIG